MTLGRPKQYGTETRNPPLGHSFSVTVIGVLTVPVRALFSSMFLPQPNDGQFVRLEPAPCFRQGMPRVRRIDFDWCACMTQQWAPCSGNASIPSSPGETSYSFSRTEMIEPYLAFAVQSKTYGCTSRSDIKKIARMR